MNNKRIQFLIDNLQESLDVEVKNWLNGVQSNDEQARLAKEVIALANHGGGYIFIGFEDENDLGFHAEIPPKSGELEAFSQDKIASIVQKYTSPSCQCSIGLFKREEGKISHPVIVVPGNHRTPVWAKKDSPTSGSANLKQKTVYIRGTGAQSRPPESQDEWEKLIDRLVKARQIEMLSSIRDIITPPELSVTPKQDLLDWVEKSKTIWKGRIESLPKDSPYRLDAGYWNIAFKISPFNSPSLSDLSQKLDRSMPKYSGWPPFTYLHREPISPKPYKSGIEAWLLDLEGWRQSPDFWRIDKTGFGFLLRDFQEDRDNYCGNRMPKPEKPCFDWLFPSYRMVEILKYIEQLASLYSDPSAEIEIRVEYVGMKGRRLECHDFNYFLHDNGVCNQDNIENTITFPVAQIETNLEELILILLSPIYEQFNFSELSPNIVKNMVKDALSYR